VQASERDAVIDSVVDQLTDAMRRVSAAAPEQELDGAAPDVVTLNELISVATHETASTIAFLLGDIRALQSRLRLREAFAEFTDDQFDIIVSQGWSLDLVNVLPSAVIKALGGNDSRRDIKRAAQEDFVGIRLAADGMPTRKAILTEVAITGETSARGLPVFELHFELDGDVIVIRTVLPSRRVPRIGKQVTVVEQKRTGR
jgi:hypothetical protein